MRVVDFRAKSFIRKNPDDSFRPVNSPKAVYQISPAAFDVIKNYGENDLSPIQFALLLKS